MVHPGVYHESVKISKNFLSLQGSGDASRGTVLEPKAGTSRCGHGAAGICIFGRKTAGGIEPVKGTIVSGFLVHGFKGFGLIAHFAQNTTVRHNAFRNNADYGATAFTSSGTKFLYNRSSGAQEAGIYVGDSPNANATVVGNTVSGNEFGFFFRDAAIGDAANNRAFGNCAGFMVLNTGSSSTRWPRTTRPVLPSRTRDSRRCPGRGSSWREPGTTRSSTTPCGRTVPPRPPPSGAGSGSSPPRSSGEPPQAET